MNKFRFEAFVHEFSCLREVLSDWAFIRPEDLRGIDVRRISRELLDCDHGDYDWFACDDEGFVLMQLSPLRIKYSEHVLLPDSKSCTEVEMEHNYTIGDAFSYFPCPIKIAFLVRLWGKGSVEAEKIVVYKRPKGFTIQGWLQEQAQRHQKILQRELTVIDPQE